MQARASTGAALPAMLGLLLLAVPLPARAETFEVKTPDVEKGARELEFHYGLQNRFPVNADPVRHGWEIGFGYGFTDWLFLQAHMTPEIPDAEDFRVAAAGIESKLALVKPGHGIALTWFTQLDLAVHRDATNEVVFGPILQLGGEKLSLTLNPFFAKSFGRNQTPGVDFTYAWQAKAELSKRVAVGLEGYGLIPEIGNSPGIDFQEHRIGPAVYFETSLGRRTGNGQERGHGHGTKAAGSNGSGNGGEEAKAGLDIGMFFGLTDATADRAYKVNFHLEF